MPNGLEIKINRECFVEFDTIVCSNLMRGLAGGSTLPQLLMQFQHLDAPSVDTKVDPTSRPPYHQGIL